MDNQAPDRETHTLHFPHLDRDIPAKTSETLFQSARLHGIRIVGACGGRGTCGSCMVRIKEGSVVHSGDFGNKKHCGKNVSSGKWIRSCEFSAWSDCTVEVAPRSVAPIVRAETATGESEFLPLDTKITATDFEVPEATLSDNLSDHDRILRSLDTDYTIDFAVARDLPLLLRENTVDKKSSLRVWKHETELIGLAPSGRRTLGLAIDLGTTNVAAFLINLETGERLASVGIENPQVAWGGDLITRINYATRNVDEFTHLQAAAIEAINALAHDLSMSVGQVSTDILDVAVCGNTAMHHLLLGLPVRQLGRAPFVAALCKGMDIKARDLDLCVGPGSSVHIAPNVGGFVGGDHVTALLASEDHWRDRGPCVVMDIGTNTEISVIHDGKFYTGSAPSGPALEGGHISCGMRAAEGAIESVAVNGGRLSIKTIDDKEAVGLCGSGVLDTLAALRRANLINPRGRLAREHPDMVMKDGKRAARLADGVYFTQDDVRAVQLAKAAIRTSTDLLLDEAGLKANEVDRFIIAGSFGAYIDIASGIDIGMFPPSGISKFIQVGNAAGIGIRRMLASCQARSRATELAANCQYMELSSRKDFQKVFLQHIGFPEDPTEG